MSAACSFGSFGVAHHVPFALEYCCPSALAGAPFLPGGNESSVSIEFDLMCLDFTGQVRTCFGEAVKVVRDPPDNWLGPFSDLRRRVMFFVGMGVSLLNYRHVLGRCSNPLGSLAMIAQRRPEAIRSTIFTRLEQMSGSGASRPSSARRTTTGGG